MAPLAVEPLDADRRPASRELIVLGTSAQVPTRDRNHNGYLLRWDGRCILFDPGEGTQRQLLRAGIGSSSITEICITHFHGDHCLGLPGVLARFALDQREQPVDVYFPASGSTYVDRLRRVAAFVAWPHVRLHPLPLERSVHDVDGFRLEAEPLHHTIDALGWRVETPARRHILPALADARGIDHRHLGRLVERGWLDVDGTLVSREEVSEVRPGQAFAFVMDTGTCDAAVSLARAADLLVCESTYLDDELELAEQHRHLTARQAAWIAAEAGARALVLTHFSQRHADETRFAVDASEVFPAVVAARDLTAVKVPPRFARSA